jgi:phosphoribosylanthranilate isomerase
MSYITTIKAGNITNLSNARYCAGMSVDIVGFPVGPNSFFGLETSKIQEITNWLAGIDIALELMSPEVENSKILEIIEVLNPAYVQVSLDEYIRIKAICNLPIIAHTDRFPIQQTIEKGDFVLFNGPVAENVNALKEYCLTTDVFISCKPSDYNQITTYLTLISPKGIELQGENEISPGLKSFDEFSEVLEILEKNE